MKLTDLHVDGFGIWSELHLSDLSDRLTVVYGVNEAGKTTLMHFLRTMLFGFSPERIHRYVPPVHGGRPGGAVKVQANGSLVQIMRHLDHSGNGRSVERLELRRGDGQAVSSATVDKLLAGVDERTFNNVFAIGLRELQELGTLDDTGAAELLYSLATGLDRVSLVEVVRALQARRDELLDAGGGPSLIARLDARYRELNGRVEELGIAGQRWAHLQGVHSSLQADIQQREEQIRELETRLGVLDAAIRARDTWWKRRDVERQLRDLGEVTRFPNGTRERLDAARKDIEQDRTRLGALRRRRRAIRREARSLPLQKELWSQAARIEALAELFPWTTSLQSHIEQLRGDIHTLESGLASSSDEPGAKEHRLTGNVPGMSRELVGKLRGPARAMREDSLRLKQARDEQEACQQQIDELQQRLETSLLERGQEELATAVEEAGTLVNRLCRRGQVGERLDQMKRQKQDLEREQRELLDGQVLSLQSLVWLGVPFVIGVVLVLAGLAWPDAAAFGWPVAVLGLCGWAVAVMAKITMERSAARELEECEQRLKLLASESKQLASECEQLDGMLPRGSGTSAARLQVAEKELAELESLVPLEADLQTARQRMASSRKRVEQATAAAGESRSRWRGLLRAAGLPDDLSPESVRRLALGTQQTESLRQQLQRRRQELEAREKELAKLGKQIEQVAEDAQVKCRDHTPQEKLRQLIAALAAQQPLFERRRLLVQEGRQVAAEARKLIESLRQAYAKRATIITAAGVRSERALREAMARQEKHTALTRELAELDRALQGVLGDQCSLAAVEQVLDDEGADDLPQRRVQLSQRLNREQAQLMEAHQQRGAALQESKALLSDRQLAETRLELANVEQQLEEAVDAWRVVAVTFEVLEKVRLVFESQRQPKALQDASRHFEELTNGRYTRVWTPLNGPSLQVDTATGDSLSLELLSCGTREAVFLSLRLALVEDFARRGISLPLVLDDVLVNFDTERAQAAARVLLGFAHNGYQLIVFTCHDHIAKLFKRSKAAFIDLADASSVGRNERADRRRPLDEDKSETERDATPEETVPVPDAPWEVIREEDDAPVGNDEPEPEEITYKLEEAAPVHLVEDDFTDEDDPGDYLLGPEAVRERWNAFDLFFSEMSPEDDDAQASTDGPEPELTLADAPDDGPDDGPADGPDDGPADGPADGPLLRDEEIVEDSLLDNLLGADAAGEEQDTEQEEHIGHDRGAGSYQRFTWGSPEHWWETDTGGEAAA